MVKEVRVILYGVGAIGSRVAKLLLEKEGVKIVGAIEKGTTVRKDLGEVLGVDRHLGITLSDDADNVLSKGKADVVVHATTSSLREAYPQIAKAVEHGVNVVSTCEELSYPYGIDRKLANKIDRLAKENGVTVLGTGVNPGFLMDTLVIVLTAVCQDVKKITVTRVMDAATRRVPFQKKIGAGLTVEEFKEKMEGKIITGHVGLEQSIGMVASALGWELDKIDVEPAQPVIAKKSVESEVIKVQPGRVAGLRQNARGMRGGKELVKLDFQAYIGAEEEYDSIVIEGVPRINEKISPCVHGDIGTVAMVVNSIPKVVNALPGLITMKDLPIPSAMLGDMRKHVKQKQRFSWAST